MRILDLETLPGSNLRSPVVTVGNFDGLHLGHQAIIKRVAQRASEAGVDGLVVTFDPHPKTVLHHGLEPAVLTPPSERNRLIADLGVSIVAVIQPTPAFLSQSPEEFVKGLLVETCGVSRMIEGSDFRFGAGIRGDLDLLQSLGTRFGFEVEVVPPVMVHGRTVSSTMIRSLLGLGEVDHVAEALGRLYAVRGIVAKGDRRGRNVGFPTANLHSVDRSLPADGVYAVHGSVEGRELKGVANIGFRPTFKQKNRTVEIHVLDFAGDLYGMEMEVRFVQWIREEAKFPTVDDLVEQIKADCDTARRLLI